MDEPIEARDQKSHENSIQVRAEWGVGLAGLTSAALISKVRAAEKLTGVEASEGVLEEAALLAIDLGLATRHTRFDLSTFPDGVLEICVVEGARVATITLEPSTGPSIVIRDRDHGKVTATAEFDDVKSAASFLSAHGW